ncbi:putative HVA22-like protein g [Tanacetum coccineum]
MQDDGKNEKHDIAAMAASLNVTLYIRSSDVQYEYVSNTSDLSCLCFVASLAFLQLHHDMGTYVYNAFFNPYISKHEPDIDRNIMELRTRAGNMFVLYRQRAASYGQTEIFDVLQYVASHSSSDNDGWIYSRKNLLRCSENGAKVIRNSEGEATIRSKNHTKRRARNIFKEVFGENEGEKLLKASQWFYPGLTGGSNDSYIRHMLLRARNKGWRVVVFNSRGCGHGPLTIPQRFMIIWVVKTSEELPLLHSLDLNSLLTETKMNLEIQTRVTEETQPPLRNVGSKQVGVSRKETLALPLALAYLGCQLQLPWWAFLLACGLAFFFTLLIGVITATTNQVKSLNGWLEYIVFRTIVKIEIVIWSLLPDSVKRVLEEGIDGDFTISGDDMIFGESINASIKEIKKDSDGNVTKLNRVLPPEGSAYKATKLKPLTWLPEINELAPLTLVEFGYLLKKNKLGENDNLIDAVNPDSRKEISVAKDANMRMLKCGEKRLFQM